MASVLSTYGVYLATAFQSEHAAFHRVGLDFIAKALIPSYTDALPDVVLQQFLSLVAHPDTAVAA